MVPVAAIERIEVVTGGASAIYGSDAVGGVVNLILKKDYNGWEVNTGYSGYSDNNGHYSERIGSLVGGVSNGTTSMTVSAEYSQSDPIYFVNRPYTNPYFATTYYPGIIDIFNATTGNDEYYKLIAGHNAPPGGAMYSIDQLVSMGYYTDLGSSSNAATVSGVQQGFNLAKEQTLQQSNKRQSATFDFDHKIFGESAGAVRRPDLQRHRHPILAECAAGFPVCLDSQFGRHQHGHDSAAIRDRIRSGHSSRQSLLPGLPRPGFNRRLGGQFRHRPCPVCPISQAVRERLPPLPHRGRAPGQDQRGLLMGDRHGPQPLRPCLHQLTPPRHEHSHQCVCLGNFESLRPDPGAGNPSGQHPRDRVRELHEHPQFLRRGPPRDDRPVLACRQGPVRGRRQR